MSVQQSTNRTVRVMIVPQDAVVELCGHDHAHGIVNVLYNGFVVAATADDFERIGLLHGPEHNGE